MTLLEILRNKLFWLMDRKNGRPVRKGLDILKRVNENFSQENIDTFQTEYIEKLLNHCIKTVPAYSGMKNVPLSKWPVVNKYILKEGGDNYLSSDFCKSTLIKMTTSGSTGTPFTSYQDYRKKKHVNAEVLYYNGLIGYTIGRRIIYLRSVVNEVVKSPLQQFMQNIYLLDCMDLSDSGISQKLKEINQLSRNSGAMILSYASTLDAFRKYFDKFGYEEVNGSNIYGIVSGSEMLQDITRESMQKAFKCKCVSRYANEENGFLGQDCVENNVFATNNANYYIEILKFGVDEPTGNGEVGRIVVTDLFNYSMPMVRYDTGDVGAWQEVRIEGIKRKAIGSFGGRRVDMILDCNGKQVSPHSITNNMWKFHGVKQFQFIQKGENAYLMKINADNQIDENLLVNILHDILGAEANIKIEYCEEIPVLASGKRRYIVNEMNIQ